MATSLLVTGNPIDGFTYIGPFKNQLEAINYADTHNDEFDAEWWVATLHAPTDDEEESEVDAAVNAANTLDRQGLIDAANETKELMDSVIAEWVSYHYLVNFDTLKEQEKEEWRKRYNEQNND